MQILDRTTAHARVPVLIDQMYPSHPIQCVFYWYVDDSAGGMVLTSRILMEIKCPKSTSRALLSIWYEKL